MLELCAHLPVGAEEKGFGWVRSDGERGEHRGVVRHAMLQDGVTGSVEQDVDDGTRRSV